MTLFVKLTSNNPPINPKLVEWLDELVAYPRGAHDDCIDSLSFAVQGYQGLDEGPIVNWGNYEAGMISAKKVDVNSVDKYKYWSKIR